MSLTIKLENDYEFFTVTQYLTQVVFHFIDPGIISTSIFLDSEQ